MRKAIVHKQPGGVVVKKPYNIPAVWVGSDNEDHPLRKSESKQQFLWENVGCCHGTQHFKWCTPAALTDISKLLCHICGRLTGAWQAAGRADVPPAEHAFMQLLVGKGESEQWCWQVVHPCWKGAIDFYSLQRRVYAQIDDNYHFINNCVNDAAFKDLRFNYAAYWAGIPVVRVHVDDLRRPDLVMAAIKTASECGGVVFTSSFRLRGFAHVQRLCVALGRTHIAAVDVHGNVLIR
jgi:hypothetical protein